MRVVVRATTRRLRDSGVTSSMWPSNVGATGWSPAWVLGTVALGAVRSYLLYRQNK